MDEKSLRWTITDQKQLLHTPVFDVLEQHEVAATGIEGDYIAMAAPDWVQVIAEHEGCFVLVRQWRHAADRMSLEFPGGVVDGGEEPLAAAKRELVEETGFMAGDIIPLGTVYPNPALFQNRFHVFLARDLVPTGKQSLDDDELLTYELQPIDEVLSSFGSKEFTHALMGAAIALYFRHERLKK